VPRLGFFRAAAFVALGVLLTGCAAASSAPPAVSVAARPGSGLVALPAPAAVGDLLGRQAAALLAADTAGYAATVGAGASAGVRALPLRLAGVRLAEWSYAVRSIEPGAGGTEQVRATLTYRLAGMAAVSTAERNLTLSGGLVVDDQPVGASLPWDLGVVTEAAGRSSLVLSVQPAPVPAAQVAAEGDRAVDAVDGVWGTDWSRQPLLVLAAGPGPLAALLGRTVDGVTGLVALATTDRVTVDATALGALTEPAQQALLTHEVTHLATRAAGSTSVPTWLEEGFADYVGLRGSSLPQVQLLAPLVARVRTAGLPTRLPSGADFQPGSATIGAAYTEAWTAVRLLVQTYGEAAVVRLYRVTAAGTGSADANLAAAFRAVLGTTVEAFTAAWRAEVARLVP
jgi:hypothetical protein